MANTVMAKAKKAPREILESIAKTHFEVESLTATGSDRHDFREVAVWTMEAALDAAYQAGLAAAKKAGR